MGSGSGAAGLAALSVRESILLSLADNGIIDEVEARAILADAAAAHRGATPPAAGDHEATAALIERILEGGNSVRHAGRAATPDEEVEP